MRSFLGVCMGGCRRVCRGARMRTSLIRERLGRWMMSQLSFDGFLFYLFWGSAVLLVAGVVVWLFER